MTETEHLKIEMRHLELVNSETKDEMQLLMRKFELGAENNREVTTVNSELKAELARWKKTLALYAFATVCVLFGVVIWTLEMKNRELVAQNGSRLVHLEKENHKLVAQNDALLVHVEKENHKLAAQNDALLGQNLLFGFENVVAMVLGIGLLCFRFWLGERRRRHHLK